jgi:hypothetical protein
MLTIYLSFTSSFGDHEHGVNYQKKKVFDVSLIWGTLSLMTVLLSQWMGLGYLQATPSTWLGGNI